MRFSEKLFRWVKSASIVCSLAATASLFSGCAGYKLGPTMGVAGERSVQVNPFQNQTLEPRLSEPITSSVRKRLQQDGTFKLDTKDESDIIVNGVITRYDRSELSFQPNDIRTVRDYNIFITAEVKAVERSTGKVILDRPVSGRTTIRVGTDLTSAERQAIPILADDLARNVTSMLTDGPW